MSKGDAYSLELERPLTAYEANVLALKGILKSKHAFQCSERCPALFTCANFNTLPGQKIKGPYYVAVSDIKDHIENCETKVNMIRNKKRESKSRLHNSGKFKINLTANGFNPPSANQNKSINQTSAIDSSANNSVDVSNTNHLPTKQINSNINSLRSLISIFNSDEFDNKTSIVRVSKITLTLEDLFFDLKGNCNLIEGNKIFHGRFWINDNTNSFLLVSTTKHLYNNIENRLSFFLNKGLINDHTLKKMENSIGKAVYIYCYSKITVTEYKTIKYLNLNFRNNPNNLVFNFD